ncbi:MAG: G1 family endopeptidase [Actinomycetota bacterium]|nr:G1 family endopeptidase [Actinomycetota bacterium]
MKKRLLVSVIPALACLALAVPALAATTQEGASENWAGYVVTPNDASGFSAVSGQWHAASVTCTANSQPAYSAYWVGLGGGGQQSTALEQIGTQADCNAAGVARYYAWYELVPSRPVKLPLAIRPGDSIWARTAVSADRVALTIIDQTTHRRWQRTLTMSSPPPATSTAEWVAEAPSACAGGSLSNCTPLPLADFGTTTFSNAHATAGGHTGTISDSRWTAEAVELAPSSSAFFGGGPAGYIQGGFGGGYYSSYAASEGAAPTSLRKGGTQFSVKYGASLQLPSSGPGQPVGQGNPYGYGYGDGYGDGYGGGYYYGGGYGGYGYGFGSGGGFVGGGGGLAALLRSLGL